jgi:hypothetical protein
LDCEGHQGFEGISLLLIAWAILQNPLFSWTKLSLGSVHKSMCIEVGPKSQLSSPYNKLQVVVVVVSHIYIQKGLGFRVLYIYIYKGLGFRVLYIYIRV